MKVLKILLKVLVWVLFVIFGLLFIMLVAGLTGGIFYVLFWVFLWIIPKKICTLVDVGFLSLEAKKHNMDTVSYVKKHTSRKIIEYLEKHRFEKNGNKTYLKGCINNDGLPKEYAQILYKEYNKPAEPVNE